MPVTQQQLAGRLQGLQNAGGLRQAILNRLRVGPGQTMTGMTAAPDFDQNIADLYRTGTDTAANLNAQEGDVNAQYQRNLAQSAIDKEKALNAVRENYASRGMYYSGGNLADQSAANAKYDQYVGDIGNTRESALQKIGNARQSLFDQLGMKQGYAERTYGDAVAKWLEDQAAKSIADNPTAPAAGGGLGGGGGGVSAPDQPTGPSAQDIATWNAAVERQQQQDAVAAWVAETNRQQALAAQRRRWSSVTGNPASRGTGVGAQGFVTGYRGPQ